MIIAFQCSFVEGVWISWGGGIKGRVKGGLGRMYHLIDFDRFHVWDVNVEGIGSIRVCEETWLNLRGLGRLRCHLFEEMGAFSEESVEDEGDLFAEDFGSVLADFLDTRVIVDRIRHELKVVDVVEVGDG